MHPSNRYSTRYPNRSLEVDPPCNPQSRIPTRSASNSTRLDSTCLEASSTPLALFTPYSKATQFFTRTNTLSSKDIPSASS